jgi:hypothetical protein
MLDRTSRYANVGRATLVRRTPAGDRVEVVYLERRFVPPADAAATLVEHRYAEGERLDTITARYFGDPTQFWQVCDANEVLRPEELTDEAGRPIVIAMPRL